MPKGFTDRGYGETLKSTEEASRTVTVVGHDRRTRPGGTRVIIADRPAALTDVRVGTVESPIVVQAWPEDTAWRDQVGRRPRRRRARAPGAGRARLAASPAT